MAHPAYTATHVADWFLRKVNRPAGDSINALKLQALLYFGEAWSLAAFNRSLLNESIQAWEHGPVVYSVWGRLNTQGWNDLDADALNEAVTFDAETEGLLCDVFQAYARFGATDLAKMIQHDAPWKDARKGLQPWDLVKRDIDKDRLVQFYRAQFDSGQSGTGLAPPHNKPIGLGQHYS